MKKHVLASLGVAFGSTIGSQIYNWFIKGERIVEVPKHTFMFVFTFVVVLAVLTLIKPVDSKQNLDD